MVILLLVFFLSSVLAQSISPFNKSALVKKGDNVNYGSYIVYKIGEGIYKINDPGIKTGKSGAFGVDMYLICGETKALMIDLGNNYILGYEKDLLPKRENAAEELRTVVFGLTGNLPLEIAISHAHPDHAGMAAAFINIDKDVILWAGEGENLSRLETDFGVDPSAFTFFKHGEKQFDLGGDRIVETLLFRGHSNGGTVFVLKNDKMIFTLDAYGNGVGHTFRSVEQFNVFAEDAQNLVDYIKVNFSPYERYELKVFVGHTWLNVYNAYYSPEMEKVDMGYLDWRYMQNLNSCTQGIIGGKWLEEGSGLIHVGNMPYVDFWPNVVGSAIMVYGLGTIVISMDLANEIAGIKIQ